MVTAYAFAVYWAKQITCVAQFLTVTFYYIPCLYSLAPLVHPLENRPMALNIQTYRKTLRYQATVPAPQLQGHLRQLAQQDRIAEKQKRKYTYISIFGGVLAFLSFFLISMSPQFGVLTLILVVATTICAVLASRWNRLDIPNLRYELPQRLADLFSRDMDRGAPLEVSIDFSSPIKRNKKICTVPYPARRGWKMDCFEDPWLQLGGQFLDRTEFTVSLMERTVSRYGWKRGRSGKSKFKRKNKFKGFDAQIYLKFPRKTYGAIALLKSDLPEAITLPTGVKLKRLKVHPNQLFLQVKIPANCALLRNQSALDGLYQLVTQLLLSAYQGLNLSKALSKSKR